MSPAANEGFFCWLHWSSDTSFHSIETPASSASSFAQVILDIGAWFEFFTTRMVTIGLPSASTASSLPPHADKPEPIITVAAAVAINLATTLLRAIGVPFPHNPAPASCHHNVHAVTSSASYTGECFLVAISTSQIATIRFYDSKQNSSNSHNRAQKSAILYRTYQTFVFNIATFC